MMPGIEDGYVYPMPPTRLPGRVSYDIVFCMTSRRMLSVRLDPALSDALERHCARTGASRSEVVKQGVAQYIVEHAGPTLSSLAESLLPPAPGRTARVAQARRQKRYRDYVREKRRR